MNKPCNFFLITTFSKTNTEFLSFLNGITDYTVTHRNRDRDGGER